MKSLKIDMDQMFDSFFDDIFNKDNKNKIQPLAVNNNTVRTTVFDTADHSKSLNIKVNPSIQRYGNPYTIETLNKQNIPSEIIIPSIIKNIEEKIAHNDIEMEKNLNKIDEKVNGKKKKISQNELMVEKQKYITDSLTHNNDNRNIENSNKRANKQITTGGNQADMPSESKKNDNDSSESLVNKITLSENLSKMLSGSFTSKLVKYSFYFGILFVIFMLALLMVKFCLAAKDIDKPIKTRHSINEIEDELNNMRGREKLF